MDADGYFCIVGRKKDMILVSGYNVYPDEVDGVLVAHPAVLEAATIGVPDAKRGEMRQVVRGAAARERRRRPSRSSRTAGATWRPTRCPRAIEFTDEPAQEPGMLKILRRELRAQELARSTTAR